MDLSQVIFFQPIEDSTFVSDTGRYTLYDSRTTIFHSFHQNAEIKYISCIHYSSSQQWQHCNNKHRFPPTYNCISISSNTTFCPSIHVYIYLFPTIYARRVFFSIFSCPRACIRFRWHTQRKPKYIQRSSTYIYINSSRDSSSVCIYRARDIPSRRTYETANELMRTFFFERARARGLFYISFFAAGTGFLSLSWGD